MTLLSAMPTMINSNSHANLLASQVMTGIVVAGPQFEGFTLILQEGFAADLFAELGNPPVLSAFTVMFSQGNGYSFSIVNNDSRLITTHSTTFIRRKGSISDDWQPLITFVLTEDSPPQFAVYG